MMIGRFAKVSMSDQRSATDVPSGSANVHTVQLRRLPECLRFPETLAERIWYDAERGQLSFRGFMSKATYDCLDALSNDNDYQRAIEELFRKSVYCEPTRQRRKVYKLVPIAALMVTVALLAVALTLPLRLLGER